MIRATITTPSLSPASERAMRDWCDRNGWKVETLVYPKPVGRPVKRGVSLADLLELRQVGYSYRAMASLADLPESTIRHRLKNCPLNCPLSPSVSRTGA